MSTQPSQRNVPLLAFVGCMVLILVIVIVQSWWSVREDRERTLSEARQNSEFAVRILDEHASRAFSESVKAISMISAALNNDPSRSLNGDAVSQLLRSAPLHAQFLASVSIYDSDGLIRQTSRVYDVWQDAQTSSRQIRDLQKSPSSVQLVIGRPLKIKDNGEWILPVAKNVFSATGELIAIVQADVRLTYFLEFYEILSRGNRGVISLHDYQGQLLARAPFDQNVEPPLLTEQLLLRAISGNQQDGSLIAEDSQSTSAEQLYAFRKISDIPVTLVFSRNVDDILQEWRGRMHQKVWFTGTTLLFIFTLGVILLIQLKRLQESRERFEASESRYRLLFAGAQDAILLINRNYEYVDCNPAAVELLGVKDASYVLGRQAGDFSDAHQNIAGESLTSSKQLVRKYVDLAFNGEVQRLDWVMQRNGSPCYIEITLSKVEINNEPLVFCVERDVSIRKKSEQLLEGQNRLLQMIGANQDPIEILNAVCDFMHSVRVRWTVGIQLLSEDQRTFVAGIGSGFPEFIHEQLKDLPVTHGNGLWSDAVMHASPVHAKDLPSDSSMQFVNQLEQLAVYREAFSWPLMDKYGQVLGCFTLLLREAVLINEEDHSFIMSMIEIAIIAIEARRSERKILRLAHYDELTGLPNRFLYNQHLSKALSLAERNQTQLAVLFLDLDRFKNINDTFGHDEGDKVLRDVAARFTRALRESDIVARIGGDEFILLIDQFSDPSDLGSIADKLLFEASQPFEIDGQECQLSASIGIATFPSDGKDAQTLLKNADIAMYRAKNKGKDNYQFYASEMNVHTVEKLAFEARLRKALERREFVVYYQPKVSVATGKIVGAEALVRWNHPDRGILFPNDFIGLAEEAGLISRLGMLVLDIACKDILSFRQIDAGFGRVAINLSASQFNEYQLLDEVRGVTEFWRVPSNALEFEITESMVMHNRDQAIVLMDAFKKEGFSLSIDDFGTGYSSLAYLKRFPVDSVKVDRSFIKDIPEDPNDTAIAHTIVAMAHTLGLKVIAEGVDSATQLQTLQNFDCDEYQGYFFSKAIPARDFIALLQQQVSN